MAFEEGLEKYMIDASIEKQIITGMIVSSEFLRNTFHCIDPVYFKSDYAKTLAKWILTYYEAYDKAPQKNIQAMFESKKESIRKDEAELLVIFLSSISKEYEGLQYFNEEYLTQQALRYFKKREIEIRAKNALAYIEKDRVEDADAEISGIKEISKITSDWYNPFDPANIVDVFEREERPIKIPGNLGEFVGGLDFGWTLLVAAGYKKGKTTLCNELAFIIASQNIPVAILSFEMKKRDINRRFFKRILSGDKDGGTFVYPAFDCKANQSGMCNRAERTNRLTLFNEEGNIPEFRLDMQYRPCTWCRKNEPSTYELGHWFTAYERPSFNYGTVFEKVREYGKFFGDDNLRIICYPRFGASVDDAFRDLDVLEHIHGFKYRVVIWDYPEITIPSGHKKNDWESINETWMRIVGRASAKNYLLIAPSQITSNALYTPRLKQDNIGRARAILGHVDAGLTINQTADDKRLGIIRVGTIIHRHDFFDEDDDCFVLQNLHLGQAHLDSQIVRGNGRNDSTR
jgi:hypothetical protein